MKETTLSIRYARALMTALEPDQYQRVRDDFEEIVTLCRENPDLPAFLNNPFVDDKDKSEIAATFAERIGFDQKLLNFLLVLIREDRLNYIEDIFFSFDKMIKAVRKKIEAEVESAIELSSDQLEKIKTTLRDRFGKEVELKTRLDSRILAGIRIRIGDKIIDSTITNNLQLLKQSIIGG